jgi:hypothetical protein
MPVSDARDSALDGWSGPTGEGDGSPPSGERESAPRGWLSRLRSALVMGRRDPEPRALLDAALALERDGGVVFAGLDGWPRPPVVQGFVPDVYAIFDDREIVLQFENDASRLGRAARRKSAAFTGWAAGSPVRIYEQIVVAGGRGGRS